LIKNGETVSSIFQKQKQKNGIELTDPENTACKIKFHSCMVGTVLQAGMLRI
jgi:hypothetical protein